MAVTVLGAVENLLLGSANVIAGVPPTYPSQIANVFTIQEPETITLPFIVIEHGGETMEVYSEVDIAEETTLRIHCFALTTAAAEALAIAAKSALDPAMDNPEILQVDNTTDMRVVRTMYDVTAPPDRLPVEIVIDACLTYKILINRARPRGMP